MDTDTLTIHPSSGSDVPKKYIRTLSGDMMTLQRGGVPDLELFKGKNAEESALGEYLTEVPPEKESSAEEKGEPKSSPIERLIEASPLPPTPILPALPVVANTPPPAIEEEPDIPKPPEPPRPAPLQTYENDFRDRMQETGASKLTLLAAEQDAAPMMAQVTPVLPEESSASSQKSRWFIGAGVSLLIISVVAIVVAYSQYVATGIPINIAQHASAPIFFDSSENISGTSVALVQAIKKSSTGSLPSNTVRFLAITATTSASNIFAALNLHAPGLLMRNIEDGGMVGIVNTSGGQYPFFILPVSSYSATFSGMLAWEPVIFNDLGTFFPISSARAPVPIATTTATTTPSNIKSASTTSSKISSQKVGFRDEVVSNHDVRVYRDAENKSLLLYGYWNQSTLVIARDSTAFAEILGRLATAHTVQ